MYSEIGGGETGAIFIQQRILHYCGYAFFLSYFSATSGPILLPRVGGVLLNLDSRSYRFVAFRLCVLKLPNLI